MKSQSKLSPIFGTLYTLSVELPPETKEDQQKQDELNAQIAASGFRTYRAAYDYGYLPLGNIEDRKREKAQKFQSGDLVALFKTVTDGDVLWSGTIDYDVSEYHHGLQKGMDEAQWITMFYMALPAKLERKDGTVIYGSTSAFAETGTEGEIWSVEEYGKNSYEALNCLNNGDKLTVYSTVRAGKIDWEGRLSFTPEQVRKLKLDEKSNWSTEILRETMHMPTVDWHMLSWQSRPFKLIRPEPTLKVV